MHRVSSAACIAIASLEAATSLTVYARLCCLAGSPGVMTPVLVAQLLDKSNHEVAPLWRLSSNEVAATLTAIGSLLKSPAQLSIRKRAQLRRGLRLYLKSEQRLGAEPPSAASVA